MSFFSLFSQSNTTGFVNTKQWSSFIGDGVVEDPRGVDCAVFVISGGGQSELAVGGRRLPR